MKEKYYYIITLEMYNNLFPLSKPSEQKNIKVKLSLLNFNFKRNISDFKFILKEFKILMIIVYLKGNRFFLNKLYFIFCYYKIIIYKDKKNLEMIG